MVIKKGSMREVINSVYQKLINDEELLRLLWYLPKSRIHKDPLDKTLKNVKTLPEYWDIVNDRIVLSEKVLDIADEKLCRILISSGRRRSNGVSYVVANQQVRIRIFVHEDYALDMRLEWILDRVSELLTMEYLNGAIGKFEYIAGNPLPAPPQYSGYEHIFEYATSKK